MRCKDQLVKKNKKKHNTKSRDREIQQETEKSQKKWKTKKAKKVVNVRFMFLSAVCYYPVGFRMLAV